MNKLIEYIGDRMNGVVGTCLGVLGGVVVLSFFVDRGHVLPVGSVNPE